MGITRQVVEVLMPVFNEDGKQLDSNEKVMDTLKNEIQEPMLNAEKYYLLHWGLKSEIAYDGQTPIVYTESVGICQHIATGHIQMFTPTSIKIIGIEKL